MIPVSMRTKICTKCNIEFPATKEYFVLDGRNKDGLGSWCRKCHNISNTAWQKKNPEKKCESNKKYHKTLRGYITCLMGNIRERCTNPSCKAYKNYGGRGIKCCFVGAELYNWLIANNIDVRGLCIHRIDNEGDYTLDNITFLDRSEHTKLHYMQRRI